MEKKAKSIFEDCTPVGIDPNIVRTPALDKQLKQLAEEVRPMVEAYMKMFPEQVKGEK